jgi:hypothetical protein
MVNNVSLHAETAQLHCSAVSLPACTKPILGAMPNCSPLPSLATKRQRHACSSWHIFAQATDRRTTTCDSNQPVRLIAGRRNKHTLAGNAQPPLARPLSEQAGMRSSCQTPNHPPTQSLRPMRTTCAVPQGTRTERMLTAQQMSAVQVCPPNKPHLPHSKVNKYPGHNHRSSPCMACMSTQDCMPMHKVAWLELLHLVYNKQCLCPHLYQTHAPEPRICTRCSGLTTGMRRLAPHSRLQEHRCAISRQHV